MKPTQERVQALIYAGFKLVEFTEVDNGVLYSAIDNESLINHGALMYKNRKWIRASNYTYGSQAEAMLDLVAAQRGMSHFVGAAIRLLLGK